MTKIIASLIILGLCANVCFGTTTVAPISSSQGSAFSGLNSSSTKVYTVANQTSDSAWDSTALSTTATVATGVPMNNVLFGPGATNDTSYVYGLITSSASSGTAGTGLGVMSSVTSITKIVKRTINNTIAGNSSDTTEMSVVGTDSSTTTTIVAGSVAKAVGPGYLALLTSGYDGSYNQVWVTLFTGTSPVTTKLTTTTDSTTYAATGNTCTITSFVAGNIWYDIGAGAFFYTYTKQVATSATWTTGATACPAYSTSTWTSVYTIYLGGIYASSTGGAYWTTPLALTPATPAHSPSSVMGGGDNWLNSSNIYVIYKDTAVSTGGANSATGITYSAKTTKANTTTAGGSFSSLVADTIVGTISSGGVASTSVVTTTFMPAGIWSSNYTFGLAVSNETETQTSTQYNAPSAGITTYTITNYLNSSLTAADSGVTYSSATGVNGIWGWQLSTGYTLVASWATAAANAYTWGTFYGNGTVNMTSTTLGSVYGPVSFYEDVNGTQWIGWTDYDTSANSPIMTTAGYLAKFQGQLNVASGASVLSALSAFALFLVSIFAF
jgi:hypothetical protein